MARPTIGRGSQFLSEETSSGGEPFSLLEKLFHWGAANSLFYWHIHTGCCADEFFNTVGAKYDLERYGCVKSESIYSADLLVVSGVITQKTAPYIVKTYEAMLNPKYVIALGPCVVKGGPFLKHSNYGALPLEQIVPVDIFIAGNPPRPEAIMYGLLQLREKIRGRAPFSRAN